MNKPLSPALVAGAIVAAVVLIGVIAFRAFVPPPTPHPDPARFLPHAAGASQASAGAGMPSSR